MKKIIYLLMVLGLVFTTACNPMDEIYDELGSEEAVISGDAVYTLTDDDYADLKIPNGFTSVDEAKSLLPNFLASLYPVWGKDSSVLVEYKMADGATNLEEINAYANAENYSLTKDDYVASGSDVMGFYPDAKPSDFLDDILADNLEGEEGDIVLVKYAQYTEDPIITTTTNFSIADNFDYGSATGDLTTITTDWLGHSGGSPFVGYATTSLSMANYPSSNVGGSALIDGFGSEDVNRTFSPKNSGTVYLSALVNLSAVGADSGTYFFHVMDDGTNFRGRVGVKSDGNGKMLFGIGASSSTLTFGATSFDFDTTYLIVASYNIDNGTSNLYVLTSAPATEPETPEATNTGNSGTTIERVAIRQGFNGPTGSVDGVRVATTWNDIMVDDIVTDVQGEKVYTELYYMFNGTYWNPSIGVYYLSTDDYDSMGTASGQPGRYNNFDNSIHPNNYIPAFLTLKYPYAQESDLLIVMYKYYAGSTSIKGNAYSVLDGMWQGSSPSLQFGHDGTKWVPDNTIKYVLTSADYELVGNGYYNNFDVRAGKAEETIEVRLEKINTILLKNFPGSAEGQKYNVFYNVYSGANEVWNTKVVLKGSAYVLQE